MTPIAQQASEIITRLNETDQQFAIQFLLRLDEKRDMERRLRNAAYTEKIQRAKDQIANGKGVVREPIEVDAESQEVDDGKNMVG
ncbi:MAG: hypothetical protein FWD96_00860 [Defluviitaleaceae bacterium]|nr:hypothetical protein [Defluviitaleaceae bacterium]